MEIITVTKFKAFDGEIFNSEKSCLAHEKELRAKEEIKKQTFLFDKDMNKTDDFGNAYFVYVASDEAAKALYDEWRYDYSTPWHQMDEPTAGKWVFNNNEDDWEPLDIIKSKIDAFDKI